MTISTSLPLCCPTNIRFAFFYQQPYKIHFISDFQTLHSRTKLLSSSLGVKCIFLLKLYNVKHIFVLFFFMYYYSYTLSSLFLILVLFPKSINSKYYFLVVLIFYTVCVKKGKLSMSSFQVGKMENANYNFKP